MAAASIVADATLIARPETAIAIRHAVVGVHVSQPVASNRGGEAMNQIGRCGIGISAVCLIATWGSLAMAQTSTAWDAVKLLEANTVSDSSRPLLLSDGKVSAGLRIEHLRNLVEAHRRIGEISQVNALLLINVDHVPQAVADNRLGAVIFTTGLLEMLASDPDLIAAVMAHEHAHFAKKHVLDELLQIPN